MSDPAENLLQELRDYILECPEVAREIDAGCNGDGLMARTLMHFDWSFDDANKHIWGDEYDEEFGE